MNQKSKKDIAFEKERVKYRKQIRELEDIIKSYENQISSLNEINRSQDEEIKMLKEWNDRLLEYMELTKDDMIAIVNNDKNISHLTHELIGISRVMGKLW